MDKFELLLFCVIFILLGISMFNKYQSRGDVFFVIRLFLFSIVSVIIVSFGYSHLSPQQCGEFCSKLLNDRETFLGLLMGLCLYFAVRTSQLARRVNPPKNESQDKMQDLYSMVKFLQLLAIVWIIFFTALCLLADCSMGGGVALVFGYGLLVLLFIPRFILFKIIKEREKK